MNADTPGAASQIGKWLVHFAGLLDGNRASSSEEVSIMTVPIAVKALGPIVFLFQVEELRFASAKIILPLRFDCAACATAAFASSSE